jgi:hypothetical protein
MSGGHARPVPVAGWQALDGDVGPTAQDWIETTGVGLGQAVRPGAQPGGTRGRVPSTVAWTGDDDGLIAVGHPGERQADLDQALAYGIAEAVDRELILVLPDGSDEPTRRRLPWLDVPVRLYRFTDVDAMRRCAVRMLFRVAQELGVADTDPTSTLPNGDSGLRPGSFCLITC